MSLSIRLTESVVFLRTPDTHSRRHLVQSDAPESVVRGLLTLNLQKPTKISSIELELVANANNNWSEGIGSRRFEVIEVHKLYAATTVFFKAESHRRTHSLGPALHDDLEDDTITPRNGSVTHTSTAQPAPPRRRGSFDHVTSHHDFISHHESVSLSPHNSPSRQDPPDQTRLTRSRSLLRSQHTFRSHSVDNNPGPSHTPSSRSSSSSRSRSTSRPPFRANGDLPTIHDHSVQQEPRGRKASRFSFSGISNAILGVIGERQRSSSRNTTDNTRSALSRLLGFEQDDHKTYGDGWKEFKKGTYNYPISFTIPGNSPPSLKCEHGWVVWRLKACVHRPGAFTTKLTATREVTVISYPVNDDTEEQSSILVQRQWENQLHYLISLSGRLFPIGGSIPIQFTFLPIAKVKIHKLIVLIEERVDYWVQMVRIGRTDPIRRIQLLILQLPDKQSGHMLPLESDDTEAFRHSPLYPLAVQNDNPTDEQLSEIASNLMGPGPWTFSYDLQLPLSCSQIRFTNRNRRSNITVSHTLQVIIRTERGDDLEIDPKTGKRKLFDIVIQTPVQILSVSLSQSSPSSLWLSADNPTVPMQPRMDFAPRIQRSLPGKSGGEYDMPMHRQTGPRPNEITVITPTPPNPRPFG